VFTAELRWRASVKRFRAGGAVLHFAETSLEAAAAFFVRRFNKYWLTGAVALIEINKIKYTQVKVNHAVPHR
jgi:hypothetical protein